jgi:hypothetical protein
MAQLAALGSSNLTAQAIVRAADREAGSPALYLNASASEALDAHAYVKLQMILDQLALSGDWPHRYDATTIQIQGRTTSLPSDFWHATFSDLYWIHPDSGNRLPVRLVDRHVFHELIRPSTQTDGPPEIACIVKNQGAADGGSSPTGVIMVDPVWSTNYWLELHYSPLAIPLAAITTKPWFPYAHYLTKALAVELLTHQDDQRAIGVAQERDRLYREIRQSQGDAGQRPRAIGFSRDVFRPSVRI